jgi:hypothetical protein cdiviTM7_00085
VITVEKNDELTKLTLHIILLEIVQKKLNQLDESLNSVAQKEKSAMSKYQRVNKRDKPAKKTAMREITQLKKSICRIKDNECRDAIALGYKIKKVRNRIKKIQKASNKANLHLQEVKQNRKYTQIQFMLFFQIKGIVCKTIARGGVL